MKKARGGRDVWLLKGSSLKFKDFPPTRDGKFENFREKDPVPEEDVSSLEVFA